MYYPRVKYFLNNETYGRIELKFDPIGWDNDQKELVRSSKYYGVFTQLSNNLEFVKDGAQYLKNVYNSEGTETDITLERFVYENIENGYQLDYLGNLDLKTYSEGNGRVAIQFLTGGLKSLVESQFDEKYELERTDDIKGNAISELEYDILNITGRRIFLESLLETPGEDANPPYNGVILQAFGSVGASQVIQSWRAIPLTIKYESDDDVSIQQSPENNLSEIYNTPYIGQGSEDIFYKSTTEGERNLTVNLDFKIDSITGDWYENLRLQIWLLVFKLNEDGTVGDFQEIFSSKLWDFSIVPGQSVFFDNVNIGIATPTDEGYCFSLAYSPYAIRTESGAGITPKVEISIINEKNSLFIEEDSDFGTTQAKTVRTFDSGERMLEIFTGKKNLFDSSFFGGTQDGYGENGEFERTCITSGMHLRQFPTQDENPNSGTKKERLAKISTSFKEIFGLNNYFNLGWGVKNTNGVERVILEKKEYFFQNKVAIDLGEVSKLKISCDEKRLFKSMTFGNETAGTYEEVHGLQEVNAKTTYVSYLTTADETYDVTGDIRADLVGMEYARRKQYENSPKEDTKYDDHNWILHLDPTQPILRKWETDFESEPIIYDPPSAGNLMLTPFRSMTRHSSFFNCGLLQNMDKKTRYANGTGDVIVATQLPGEPVRYENSDIVNNEMEVPIFKAEYLEFEKPLTTEIKKQLMGNTNDIPNVNLLIKFSHKGTNYQGWLVNLKMNDPGNWKLLKHSL